MSDEPIRVLCVDDSPELTRAWERYWRRQGDLLPVGSRDRADHLVEAVRQTGAQVVVLDLTMAGRDPLDALRELSFVAPHVRVIVCSGHSDPSVIASAMDAGAWRYVDKADEPHLMLDAIRAAARGG